MKNRVESLELNNSKKLPRVKTKTQEALKEWKGPPSGVWGIFANILSSLNIYDTSQQEAADTPYVFKEITAESTAALQREDECCTMITVACTVVAVACLAIGLLGPLAAVPFLISLPLSTASTVIVVTTIVGIIGVVVAVASAFFTNPVSLRQSRVDADPDFRYFVEEYIQGSGMLFNLNDEQVIEKKIHQIYVDWKYDLANIE